MDSGWFTFRTTEREPRQIVHLAADEPGRIAHDDTVERTGPGLMTRAYERIRAHSPTFGVAVTTNELFGLTADAAKLIRDQSERMDGMDETTTSGASDADSRPVCVHGNFFSWHDPKGGAATKIDIAAKFGAKVLSQVLEGRSAWLCSAGSESLFCDRVRKGEVFRGCEAPPRTGLWCPRSNRSSSQPQQQGRLLGQMAIVSIT